MIPTRRFKMTRLLCGAISLAALTVGASAFLTEPAGLTRTEHFDRDPAWDGKNNRSSDLAPATVTQDFGYSATSHAGGKAGEIGGVISPAGEAAYYAKVIPKQS